MDLDHARHLLMMNPTDPDTITNVVLELLELVGTLDTLIARQRQRIEVLEAQAAPLPRLADRLKRYGGSNGQP